MFQNMLSVEQSFLELGKKAQAYGIVHLFKFVCMKYHRYVNNQLFAPLLLLKFYFNRFYTLKILPLFYRINKYIRSSNHLSFDLRNVSML